MVTVTVDDFTPPKPKSAARVFLGGSVGFAITLFKALEDAFNVIKRFANKSVLIDKLDVSIHGQYKPFLPFTSAKIFHIKTFYYRFGENYKRLCLLLCISTFSNKKPAEGYGFRTDGPIKHCPMWLSARERQRLT